MFIMFMCKVHPSYKWKFTKNLNLRIKYNNERKRIFDNTTFTGIYGNILCMYDVYELRTSLDIDDRAQTTGR